MSPEESRLIDFLYAALNSPIGVLLSYAEGTLENERQALYRARKNALDPQLMTLQIRLRPDNRIAIIHKDSLL